MSDSKFCPIQQVSQACGASREEIKVQGEAFAVAADTTDRLDGVLETFKLSKAINICAWRSTFPYNSRHPDQKLSSPLTTEEIRKQRIFWVKRAQKSCDFQDHYLRLNLQHRSIWNAVVEYTRCIPYTSQTSTYILRS